MFKGRYYTTAGDAVAVHEIDKSYQGDMKEGAAYWGHQIVVGDSSNLSPQIPKKFWQWNEKGDCVYYVNEGEKETNPIQLHFHDLKGMVNPQTNIGSVEVAGCMACTKDRKEREELITKRKNQYASNPELLQVASPANPVPSVSANCSPLDMLEDIPKKVVGLREYIEQFMEEREIDSINGVYCSEINRVGYDRLVEVGRLINAIRSNPHGK